jgi:S1-C subfamily serine protease
MTTVSMRTMLSKYQVIGVAFQGREDAENVGFIIPSSVVNHFLQDIERNGVYSGFVTLGMTVRCPLRTSCGIDRFLGSHWN